MRLFAAVACVVVVACGSDGAGAAGDSGPDFPVAPTVLSETLGAPFALSATTGPFPPIATCYTPTSDGALMQLKFQSGFQMFDVTKTMPGAGKPAWSATLGFDSGSADGCILLRAPDGGAVMVADLGDGPTLSGISLLGISPTGTKRFVKVIPTPINPFLDEGAVGVTKSGTIVVPFKLSDPNVPDAQAPLALHGFDPLDGHEVFSTVLPPQVIPGIGDGVTAGFAGSGNYPPDHAGAIVTKIVGTPDGGFAALGTWLFQEQAECGTETNPQRPSDRSCAVVSEVGMVARFDAAGALRWSIRIGAPYQNLDRGIASGIALADGSILAIGSSSDKKATEPDAQPSGLAVRVDPNGKLVWGKVYHWSATRKPGINLTGFMVGVPAGDGARIVVRPPDALHPTCPLVEIDANGAITRAGTVDAANCVPASFDNQLYVIGGATGWSLSLIAP